MGGDVLVKVDHVSKKYCKSLKQSMFYGMNDIGRNMLRLDSKPEVLRKDEFWAVNDVSFELKRGETLGLIGSNGSGKTSLLKMLNGIFWPDKGEITIRGRVGALIAVGAGFHPVLTGRENIYVNGAILGMTKQELDKQFDAIVDFADIGDFLDTPVKYYSSGMFVRLGFAVAVHCEPDILLIDEVLAVGDASFRGKCYNMIADLKKKCSVILVSHDMGAIARVCDRCIFLSHGDLKMDGAPVEVIQAYYSNIKNEGSSITRDGINSVKCVFQAGKDAEEHVFISGSSMKCVLEIDSLKDIPSPLVSIHFLSVGGDFCGEWNSALSNAKVSIKKGVNRFNISIDSVNLAPGVYDLSFLVTEKGTGMNYYWDHRCLRIKLEGAIYSSAICQLRGHIG